MEVGSRTRPVSGARKSRDEDYSSEILRDAAQPISAFRHMTSATAK